MKFRQGLVLGVSAVALLGMGRPAKANTAGSPTAKASASSLEVVVVTANKRRQSINSVPLSITAIRGDQLIEKGVTSTADLAKMVPGFTAQPSPFNTPIYTMRGVGFYDSTLSASPTVAVYTDQVPLPFSAMTTEAGLDLERVEVLKGPQGTLFGENTTGGAINYIAAKPTDHFTAGFDESFGRFSQNSLQGFISGPLTDNLKARLSASVDGGDGWQHSNVNNSTLGAISKDAGRLLLDWTPTDKLSVELNLNGWLDNSDNQAPQRIATFLSVPSAPQAAAILAYPYPALNAQSADWSTNIAPLQHHDYFMQAALRANYILSDAITLTSITAAEQYRTNSYDDFDGTALNVSNNRTTGYINTISQELRASGKVGKLNWVTGGNFETDATYDKLYYWFGDATTSQVGPYHMTYTSNFTKQDVKTGAVFANGEYEILPNLTLQGGARYTVTNRDFSGCTQDIPGGGLVGAFQFLETIFRNPSLPFVSIPPGGCVTFNTQFAPIVTPLQQKLDEHNLSWRTGLSYKTPNSGLVYVTFAQGYKAGGFPTTSASTVAQYTPVKQEGLLAYEVGFKQPFFENHMQANGALFYYDYSNKQLEGRVLDPVFGPLSALVQIPQSHVEGAEASIVALPIMGLRVSVAATYLQTRIDAFTGYNNAGVLGNFAGSAFPYSPNWQVVSDGTYNWTLNNGMGAYAGASLTYNGASNGSIGDNSFLKINAYSLLDLRAGVTSADGRWRFELWGRNVTNTYYWTNALQSQDVYLRYTGMPATYGLTIGYRFD